MPRMCVRFGIAMDKSDNSVKCKHCNNTSDDYLSKFCSRCGAIYPELKVYYGKIANPSDVVKSIHKLLKTRL